MLRISIANRQRRLAVSERRLRRIVRLAAPPEWRDAEISLAIVGHDQMVRLNRRFTGRHGDTDVLAFAMGDRRADPDSVVGEVIVCATRAAREARARGVGPEHELLLYVVHGVLHLLGFDDHSPRARKTMYAREARVLALAGIPCVRNCPPGP